MLSGDGSMVVYTRIAVFLRFWDRGLPEEKIRTLYIAQMEQALRLQRESSWRRFQQTMPGFTEIYDLQGLAFSHLTAVKGLRLMSRILKIGADHYPDNLGKAIFINVPGFALKMFYS